MIAIQYGCSPAFRIIKKLYDSAAIYLDRKYKKYLQIKEFYANRDNSKIANVLAS